MPALTRKPVVKLDVTNVSEELAEQARHWTLLPAERDNESLEREESDAVRNVRFNRD